MPDDFKRCKGIVAAWGLGGEAFSFPAETGYPVGEEHGGATYYMFEVHYDNPGYHSGIVDSSGLEILLTPNLRKYDSGLMAVGHDVSSLHLIPPGLEHYTSVGHCPDLCTSVINLKLQHGCCPDQTLLTYFCRACQAMVSRYLLAYLIHTASGPR